MVVVEEKTFRASPSLHRRRRKRGWWLGFGGGVAGQPPLLSLYREGAAKAAPFGPTHRAGA
jgi:hypothetical protein